ncbi:MAG: hypothetical protein KatS3mg104_0355 [Phycisphaerae bacterium]|jgi:hypothetical protein|nr:MAG: hypothetical protein KatS3mg104_0355 [Phycisphaerae bacterium]
MSSERGNTARPIPDQSVVALRVLELLGLFVIPPLIWMLDLWRPHVLAGLIVLAAYSAGVLLLDPSFQRWKFWNIGPVKREIRAIIVLFVPASLLFLLVVWLFESDNLFRLIRDKPMVWAMVMLGYPLLSVYPQELLYRVFFFHRYSILMPKGWQRIWGSALVFSWGHVIFGHWIPVVLTLIGGWIFAQRYEKTRSIAVVWLEHTLYGCLIFTIGLGSYFFHGTLLSMSSVHNAEYPVMERANSG